MDRRTRRIVFYSFVILFIAVGTAVVAYSQGWRFDFKAGRFEKTGGIYLRIEPADAEITLDGKGVSNQSGLFQSGTLISNLIKGVHHLKISKNGYFGWEKSVAVEPGGAAVFDKILLLPQDNAQKIDEPAGSFAMLDGKAVEVKDGAIIFGDRLVRGSEIVDVSPGGRIITASASGTYYLTDLSGGDGASLNLNTTFTNLKQSQLNMPGTVPITAIDFHPFDDARLVIETGGGLYIMDTKNLSLEQIVSEPFGFIVSGDQLVWAARGGIWSYNLILHTPTKISGYGLLPSDPAEKIKISPSGSLVAVLQRSGMLMLMDYASQSSLRIAYKVKEFAFSPDSRYLAYADRDGPLSVYRVDRPQYMGLSAIKGAPVVQLDWYKDSAHLFALREGNLDFIEVGAEPTNVMRVATRVSEFNYTPNTDAIYYLTPGGLFNYSIVR